MCKMGDRVRVNETLARAWGHNVLGTVVGPDPAGEREDVVAVRMDDGPSIFETKGVDKRNLEVVK